jgi:deoxyadenosine/deoxycytidine kinase
MAKTLPLVTLVGNIGSGKSTAMPILLEALKARPLYADDLFQVDPFAPLYLDDIKRWAFTHELWLTHQRSLLLKEHVKLPENNGTITVIDSGLLMSWVYTYSHFLVKNISLDEWEFYENLYDQFSTEVLLETGVVRLKYTVPTLLKRITKRGRDYELKYYTAEYLEQIEMGLDALEKKLVMKGVPFTSIDEEDIADFENSPKDTEKLISRAKSIVYREK